MIIVTTGPRLFEKGVVKALCDMGLKKIRIPTSKQPPLVQLDNIIGEIKEGIELIVDFPGSKYRLNNPGNFLVEKGDILKINNSGSVYDFDGTLSVYPDFDFTLNEGDVLIVGDGESAFTVVYSDHSLIEVRVEKSANFGPRRGLTPLGKEIDYKILTEIDMENLDCLKNKNIKGVMLSFIESIHDIEYIKNLIRKKYNREVKIYAKIETPKGIRNSLEIVKVVDYLVLARGDLLVTSGEEQFPVLQEVFLKKMTEYRDKVIIATELAHSVGQNYLMSRSELSFLYYIFSSGFTNLMLASETTVICDPCEVYKKLIHLMSEYSKNSGRQV